MCVVQTYEPYTFCKPKHVIFFFICIKYLYNDTVTKSASNYIADFLAGSLKLRSAGHGD